MEPLGCSWASDIHAGIETGAWYPFHRRYVLLNLVIVPGEIASVLMPSLPMWLLKYAISTVLQYQVALKLTFHDRKIDIMQRPPSLILKG